MGGPTSGHGGVRALLVGACLQGLLGQLLQVPAGGGAEALQRQGHVLLPDEQRPHHTLGRIQQVCEGHLETEMWTRSPRSQTQPALTSFLRPVPRRHSDHSVLNKMTSSQPEPLPLQLSERETAPLASIPIAPDWGSPSGCKDGDTHPTLLLTGDGHPLKLPLQHHIALPQAPVTLPLTLLLVEPASGEDKGGAGSSRGTGPSPTAPASPCPPHWKSESLSVFRKSCLARSRMSGSSLEARGEGRHTMRPVLLAGPLHCPRCRARVVTCGPHRAEEPSGATQAALAPRQR